MTICSIDSREYNGKSVSTLLWCLGKDEGKQYNALIDRRSVTGNQSEIASALVYEGWKGEIVRPGKEVFVASNGKNLFVKCNRGVQEGALYLLSSGILFLKPALFLPTGTILSVTAGRAGCVNTRYIDLKVVTDNCQEFEFSNIDREELLPLQQYVRCFTKPSRGMKRLSVIEDKRAHDEVSKYNFGSREDDDDGVHHHAESDESDEDYNPDTDDSAGEYDNDDVKSMSIGRLNYKSDNAESSVLSSDFDDDDDDYASEEELVLDEDMQHLPSKRIKSDNSSADSILFRDNSVSPVPVPPDVI